MYYKFYLRLLLFGILLTKSTFAQTVLSSLPKEIKVNKSTETISIIDKEENIHLFFINSNRITHLKHSVDYNLLASKTHTSPFSRFPEVLGFGVASDNSIQIYFSNSYYTRFAMISVTSEGIYSTEEFNLGTHSGIFLEAINKDNLFHIFTYAKKGSLIKRYTFDKNNFTLTEYDLNEEKFYDRNNKPVTLSEVFRKKEFAIIEDNAPNSIETAAKKVKLYPKGKDLIITLNHRKNATRIIRLSLVDIQYEVSHFFIPTVAFAPNDFVKSNSFIHEDRIYQLIASKNLLVFNVHSVSTGEKIKEYSFTKDEDIPILNSPIYQDGTAYFPDIKRSLERTKQYLRKITHSDIGLVIYEKQGRIYMTMGGTKDIKMGGGPLMPMAGIPIANYGSMALSVNPMFWAYNSYSSTRSVYVKCVFDSITLDHLDVDVGKNVFDKIKDYTFSMGNSAPKDLLRLETIFQHRDYVVFGYYQKKEKVYHLVKFDD